MLIENTYSAGELMGIFKKLKLLAAMRLHSLVYAASVNLPMVGIIYDPKVEAMVKELGIEEAIDAVSYTHLTLPTTCTRCRSRWSPYH